MIELRNDALVFSFPEVHPDARFSVDFQRTLRIPDDGRDYPLPAGLGRFPLRHVDDFAARVPARWRQHGGVMMPMYQSEALWLSFGARGYPFALKVAAGKINAVTGEEWRPGLHFGPSPSTRPLDSARGSGSGSGAGAARGTGAVRAEQDYVVLPAQPWLDGFNVGDGRIRQFVAMPLGEGYTAEEQVTGKAETGGIQLVAYPMKKEFYVERLSMAAPEMLPLAMGPVRAMAAAPEPDMGLGLGGLMRQDISADPHDPDVWDLDHAARCFAHLTNSVQWATITGEAPPTKPVSAEDYRKAGIPWFSYYAQGDVVPGSDVLKRLKTVTQVAVESGDPVGDNDPIPIDRVTHLQRPARPEHAVREFPDAP